MTEPMDTYGVRIGRVDPNGIITAYVGTGETGTAGNDGPALAAQLDGPNDILMSPSGVLYIAADSDPCIRAVGTDGVVRSVWCRPT